MTFNIRYAEISDLEQVQAIYANEVQWGTASFELTPPDRAEVGRRYEVLISSGYPYLVAELHDLVVGYAYAGSYRPRPAYRYAVENSVYIHRDYHRLGIGQALLARLISECEARNFRQMVAIIGDSAHLASIKLHQRCGFHMVGTLKNIGYKNNRWLDSVLMQRGLGEGAQCAPTADNDLTG